MNRLPKLIRALIAAGLTWFAIQTAAAESTEPLPEPTTEQRIADLEAYVNNTARTADVASHVSGPGPGHNAWLMTSAVLVLFMTLPGLALFYGGLVRRKNVLSVLAQCLGIAGLVTILWWAVGFSLAFGTGNAFVGGLDFAFFKGVDSSPSTLPWVSQNVFAIFQLTFAIITPALIIGA
ncbi:MAG TPA: ammonia channel protein, partial [Opitutus sp.]|nr:ammonia channel protein [Opitutus sp.]